MKSLSILHKDANAYEERGKGRGIPGFQMKWSALNRQPSSIAETDLLQYEDFRRVYYKWHSKLLKAFEQGLLAKESVHPQRHVDQRLYRVGQRVDDALSGFGQPGRGAQGVEHQEQVDPEHAARALDEHLAL